MNKNFSFRILISLSSAVYGNDPLIKVATNGNLDEARKAINSGVNVNTTDKFGNTILSYASEYGHTEIVKLLEDAGAKNIVN